MIGAVDYFTKRMVIVKDGGSNFGAEEVSFSREGSVVRMNFYKKNSSQIYQQLTPDSCSGYVAPKGSNRTTYLSCTFYSTTNQYMGFVSAEIARRDEVVKDGRVIPRRSPIEIKQGDLHIRIETPALSNLSVGGSYQFVGVFKE